MRVKFHKGQQRRFFKEVLENANCPSLRNLIERGFDIPYSTLKSYFNENRTLPKELFDNLSILGNINLQNYEFSFLEDNWGKVKGGNN